MRELASQQRILEFMARFGRIARAPVSVYFTGGTSAVLLGWRESTVDIDLKFIPETDILFRSIPEIKEQLKINVELASPPDFIPELPGWEDRSIFIDTAGKTSFFHYDPYSQALSKIERSHEQDLLDVRSMIETELVQPPKLMELFTAIKDMLYKYPAIDPKTFESSVIAFLG